MGTISSRAEKGDFPCAVLQVFGTLYKEQVSYELLRDMTDCIRHRGPYDEGQFFDSLLEVHLFSICDCYGLRRNLIYLYHSRIWCSSSFHFLVPVHRIFFCSSER